VEEPNAFGLAVKAEATSLLAKKAKRVYDSFTMVVLFYRIAIPVKDASKCLVPGKRG
jgi:hypothetical protein